MRGAVCCGACARTIAPAASRATRLVALQAQGDAEGGRVVAEGHDFYAAPRLSPDGTQLAWLSWNHPDMPWDGCELWLADVDDAGRLHGARRLAGSRDEAVQQPQWSPDGRLHFISDRSGWWNLYRWGEQGAEALCPMEAEFGQPMWNFGLATYGFASARQLVCSFVPRRGVAAGRAGHGDARRCARSTRPSAASATWRCRDDRVLFTGASPLQAASVCLLHLDDGRIETLRRGSTLDADPDYSSVPEAIEFPTAGGLTAHAFFYPPRNRDFRAPAGEKPPLLVMSHGGPTSMAGQRLPRRRAVLDQPRHRRARRQLRRQHRLRPRLPPAARRPVGRGRRDGLHPRRAIPGGSAAMSTAGG